MEISMKIALLFAFVSSCDSLVTYRFLSGNLTSSNRTCIDPFIEIKPISRATTSLNIGCKKLTKSISTLFVSCKTLYKRNFGNYRQVIAVENFEVCDLVEAQGNPLFAFIFKWFLPLDLVKRCPLKDGDFTLYNLTYPTEASSIWPDGYYRSTLSFKESILDKEFIFSSTTVLKVTNTNNILEF